MTNAKRAANSPSTCRCHGRMRGADCREQTLIDAHIIARGFARRVRRTFDNMEVTAEGASKAHAQLGLFDKNILCKTCDQKLGVFDDYAMRMIDRIPGDLLGSNEHWLLPDVDGDTFAKFILSVLWRGSISTLDEYSQVKLGPYSNLARSVLFDELRLSDFPAFQVFLGRYRSVSGTNINRFYSLPMPTRMGALKGYGFALCGFEVYAKLDSRLFPKDLQPMIVNGNTALRGLYRTFEQSGPFETTKQAIRSKIAAAFKMN